MVQYYTDSKSWRTKLWFTVIYCIKPTILKPFPPYCPLFCAAQGISWTEDRLLQPIPSLQQLATVEGGRGVQTLLSLCFTNTVKERAILLKQNRHFFLSGTSEDDATFQWAKQGNKQHTSRKSHLCEKFGSKKKPAVQLEEVYTLIFATFRTVISSFATTANMTKPVTARLPLLQSPGDKDHCFPECHTCYRGTGPLNKSGHLALTLSV